MSEENAFNLVYEPWIKVRLLDGEMKELSLVEVFRNAASIASLANDLPTQDFSILRVLLSILQRSVLLTRDEEDNPAEVWGELWDEGLPIDAIEEYLETWAHRFNLFDSVAPFMQVAGMHTEKNELSSIAKIILKSIQSF